MINAQHEKFAQLMGEVEELEELVAAAGKESEENLLELKAALAEARNRLAQLSDGCGTGHSHIV